MKKNIALLLLVTPLFIFGQIKLNQIEFNLGEISLLNSDIVDFDATNITSNTAFLLRIEGEQNVGFQYTSKTFQPNKTEGIRVKLNPNKKGKIERKVKLYFSSNDEPIEISIKAIVKELPKNNRTACPQFGSTLQPPTGKPQPVAQIQKFNLFLQDLNGEPILAENTPLAEVKKAETPARRTTTTNTTVTRRSNPTPNTTERPARPKKPKKIRKTPEERRNSPSLGTILFGKDSTSAEAIKEVDEIPEKVEKSERKVKEATVEEVKESPKSETIAAATKEETEKPQTIIEIKPDILLDESFKPNNIVFLIDASTSMREEQKMDILKTAMIELLTPLRSIDFITIVTYSGEAKVIVPTSSGNLKEDIVKQIESLEADGSTNAVKGIKKAITVGKSNFLEEGNNQIFLASDGAFNIGERNMSLRKKIKKTANEGLTITVLGIKNDNWTNKSLKEIADLGEGDLLKIKSMKDAGKVLESMKRKAKR